MGRSWVFLLDVHLYYFTRATIRKLLEDAGFDIVRIRPAFPTSRVLDTCCTARRRTSAHRHASPNALLRRLGVAEWQVPYWMGQTLVIARKRATV